MPTLLSQLVELAGKFLIALANTIAALMVVMDVIRRRHPAPLPARF